MIEVPAKTSDLPVRAASAVVMIAVAGAALWLGGTVWAGFVALVALGTMWEYVALARALAKTRSALAAWLLGGLVYIGMAALMLFGLRLGEYGVATVLVVVLAVIGTDIGAYFAGRTIGGPKIAPAISPSKTWSGLLGGMVGAGGGMALAYWLSWKFAGGLGPDDLAVTTVNGVTVTSAAPELLIPWPLIIMAGPAVAVIAQAGDFFESWMKRRAGVKDSGRLIPGHGGLFDRVDGLLAVLFALALASALGLAGG
ncbi:phosphatidate cytidylyltransferase [Novosphingobium sp.]|uniref:phosphatidate cytidylyltransferase n=1 Tax=Novosphingobium sp. TaxID=1874826 RepID=UPI002736004C|nr:phosphatidate cytidylyltransferase [Novosphingobium sp.]MDP3907299.1 phosphatidate cytidylyltransferase [Novosphingobium sp.]